MKSSPTIANLNGTGHGSDKVFVRVFAALCILTLISVLIAYVQIFPTRTANWLAFLGLAMAKASLVVCYFMHLRWERIWKYFLTIPALILGAVLVLSLLPDVGMRSLYYSSDRSENGPDVRLENELEN